MACKAGGQACQYCLAPVRGCVGRETDNTGFRVRAMPWTSRNGRLSPSWSASANPVRTSSGPVGQAVLADRRYSTSASRSSASSSTAR